MRRDSWLQLWRNIRPMKHASELDLPKLLTREHHKIHLIGVAGSGMSGIAALLLGLGHEVSGSDKASTVETDRLQRLGLRFHQNHHADDARDADLMVFSSAITINNPILLSARDFGKPAVRRAELLAAIMRKRRDLIRVFRERRLSRHRHRVARFCISVLCLSSGPTTWRSSAECSRPAQRPKCHRCDRVGERAWDSV